MQRAPDCHVLEPEAGPAGRFGRRYCPSARNCVETDTKLKHACKCVSRNFRRWMQYGPAKPRCNTTAWHSETVCFPGHSDEESSTDRNLLLPAHYVRGISHKLDRLITSPNLHDPSGGVRRAYSHTFRFETELGGQLV